MSDYKTVESVVEFTKARVGAIAQVDGQQYTLNYTGAYADSPRPLGLSGGHDVLHTTFEELQAKVDNGTATLWVEVPECSYEKHGGCRGEVEYRFTGRGLRSRLLCEAHQEQALAVTARANEYLSDTPPAWFDEGYAGERWGDDY